MQRKVVYAGVVASSFANAADLLLNLARLSVLAKPVERLTRAVGEQRVAARDRGVAAFAALPLAAKFDAPAGVAAPDLAVVMVDGGRSQIRERAAPEDEPAAVASSEFDEQPADAKGFWREDKVGLLVEMKSEAHQADPCPQVPPVFLDVLRIPRLARELGKTAARTEGEAVGGETGEPLEPEPDDLVGYDPPEVGHRRVVASCRPWPEFAVRVAQAARAAGFQKAKRKAFVADGSANNWRLRARHFGSFVAVLDFIHALSYVYAAATAGRRFEQGWKCYREWIGWVWEGKVAKVIEALCQRQQEMGEPSEGESETSPRSIVAKALGYLSNHQDKMKYDEYRKEGLPITSSLMESVVKQMNQRVKGSEKFWCGQGAEAIVQLRADHLDDDQPLDDFWRQRQAAATGQRPYRRAA